MVLILKIMNVMMEIITQGMDVLNFVELNLDGIVQEGEELARRHAQS